MKRTKATTTQREECTREWLNTYSKHPDLKKNEEVKQAVRRERITPLKLEEDV